MSIVPSATPQSVGSEATTLVMIAGTLSCNVITGPTTGQVPSALLTMMK